MREQLKAFYLEYVNAYITVAAMSDYKHMSEADTQACIDMGRRIHEEDAARLQTLENAIDAAADGSDDKFFEAVAAKDAFVESTAKDPDLFGYVGFYNGKRHELRAPSLYAAKQAMVKHFKAPRSKEHMVSVMLAERADGSEVAHSTGSL